MGRFLAGLLAEAVVNPLPALVFLAIVLLGGAIVFNLWQLASG